ncbi:MULTISPECIES: hypothetical protein [Streptomyces]|uniref:hypothetical protein n=1 Tax=Streptomyces TaxID=1883 RepID=UPI0019A6A52A|nr:hypothetical protein GCM10010272_37390 [Streptomyces lateritius]
MTRARRLPAGLALAGALLALPGCASSVDPIERLGRKAAERVGEGRAIREAAARVLDGTLRSAVPFPVPDAPASSRADRAARARHGTAS